MGVATSTTHFSTDIVVKDQPAWIGFTHQGEGDMSIDNLRIEKLDPRPASATSTQAAVFPDACKPAPRTDPTGATLGFRSDDIRLLPSLWNR